MLSRYRCQVTGVVTTFLLFEVSHHVSSVVFERQCLSEPNSPQIHADKAEQRPAAELTFLQFTPVICDKT